VSDWYAPPSARDWIVAFIVVCVALAVLIAVTR